MNRVHSEDVLVSKGYSYLKHIEASSEPEYVDVAFRDIVPELSLLEIGSQRLYKHQYSAYLKLKEGGNVVLRAGTGSGKTESWVLYLLEQVRNGRDFHAIAIYPTLALANDQIKRLEKYVNAVRGKLIQLDSVRKEELLSKLGNGKLRSLVNLSNLVITNPAFLLHDLKKYFVRKEGAVLSRLYTKLNLLVIDELDFYGPRSLALLLAMTSLLSKIAESGLQVAVLSAGIANPEDLCTFLEDVTKRECASIEGAPFRVENHVYIVLGKNIETVWNVVRGIWREAVVKHPELKELSGKVHDFNEFKRNVYQVVSILESLGYKLPSLHVDPAELIAEYSRDKYVTLVFTRGINTAEELVKSIRSRYGEGCPLASHHHLVPKKTREIVEEKARRGEVKVIVSPRTLSQGIDIGLVARIVHLGLPDSVREFHQREGRKGRRKELGFSETVIVPYSRWDKELLASGIDALKQWLDLGLERTLINPNNLYTHLFTGIIKLLSPWFRQDLDVLEREALKRTGVLDENNYVNGKRLKEVFDKLNFYEYAPPYGIKRYLEKDGRLVPLEPIGHCDLVEKFQPGCMDPGEDALVVLLEHGKTSRTVKCVLERSVREVDFRAYNGLSAALEEYRYIKLKWGETPHIVKDLLAGRVSSEVMCIVYTPRNGFGKYIKVPERCIWTVKSEKPRYVVVGNRPVVYYDKRTVYVPLPTGGEYRDFTYGYAYSVDPREDAELIRVGLAYLVIVLRRYFGIPLGTVLYDVTKIGEYKYFSLYEPEAAGLVETIDWPSVRKLVESHKPDDLDRIMMSEIDDMAYSTLITMEFNWDLVKEHAVKVVDYVLARDRVKAMFRGKEMYIPRPSPALKLLSYSIISEVLDGEAIAPSLLTGHGVYNGETFLGDVDVYPSLPLIKPPQPLLRVEEAILDKVFYEDYKLIVEDRRTTLVQLRQANLKRLVSLVENDKGQVIDLSMLAGKCGMEFVSVEELSEAFGSLPSINYASIRDTLRKVREYRKTLQREREEVLKYLEERSKSLYIAYLVLNELLKDSK
ncbi:MAG: DEAD/DEAH box helicase [Desulfurococcaceae archaeon]